MNIHQIEQEISIIKEMIDKTRKETAESGHFFIFIGLFSAVGTFAIGMVEIYNLKNLLWPAIIVMAVVNAFLGSLIGLQERKNEKVKAYPKTIFWNLWMACGITAIIIAFLLPFLDIYAFRAVPILVSLLFGIAVFLTGVIFELRFIRRCSLAWWLGAGLMALTNSPFQFLIMVVVILTGWVLPGFKLNQQKKSRSKDHES